MKFPNINQFECGVPSELKSQADGFVIKPETATICGAGNFPSQIQLAAFTRGGSGETAVTSGVTWASDDTSIATVDSNGLVTGVSKGVATITAQSEGNTAFSMIEMLANGQCCGNIAVGTIIAIDRSASMGGAFNDSYPTLFAVAKKLATSFVDGLDVTKDVIGLVTFYGAAERIVSQTADIDTLADAISDITLAKQNPEITDIHAAIKSAMFWANQCAGCKRKVVILISDGVNNPEMGGDDYYHTLNASERFKEKGGIIVCVGIRSSGSNYLLLQAIASVGYFINVWGDGTDPVNDASQNLLGLRGYWCGDYYTGGYLLDTPLGEQSPASDVTTGMLPAPVLSSDPDEENLQWTYSDTDPTNWQIQQSFDSGATWTDFGQVAGTVRSTTPPNARTYRIFGVNASNIQITHTSNSVFIF